MLGLRWLRASGRSSARRSIACQCRLIFLVLALGAWADGQDDHDRHGRPRGHGAGLRMQMPQMSMPEVKVPEVDKMMMGALHPLPMERRKVMKNRMHMEGLMDGIIHLAKHSQKCGVSAKLHESDGRWVRPNSLSPVCGEKLLTNCTVTYMELTCPDACPFLVPDQHYPCRFMCVEGKKCSEGNLNRALSNPETNMCDFCDLEGCKWCKSEKECKQCFDGFHLAEVNGKMICQFTLDKNNWAVKVLLFLVVLVVLIIFTGVCYCCAGSRHALARHNYLSICQGRRQRHLGKVQKWELGSSTRPREFYNLAVNVHAQNILGVGFALFYNTILFYLVIWGVMYFMTDFLYNWSDLKDALPRASSDYGLLASEAIHLARAEPAVLVTGMQKCWKETSLGAEDTLHIFAVEKCACCCLMLLFMFCAGLYYAKMQKRFAGWFDARNSQMSDFVLIVHGLPLTAIHEGELKTFFANQVKKLDPDAKVHGVSIGYDYKHVEGEVSDMLTRLNTRAEKRLDAGVPGSEDVDGGGVGLEEKMAEDRATVLDWFKTGKMESTGVAFIVFEKACSVHKVLHAYQKDPTCMRYPNSSDEQLDLHIVESQPPDFFWENLGTPHKTIYRNVGKAMMKVTFFVMLIDLLVVIPYTLFMVLPYVAAGRSAGGPKTMVAGIILGIVNAQLGGQVWNCSFQVGFSRKDRLDMCIFVMNTILTLANTVFNIYINLYLRTNLNSFSSWESIRSSKDIGEEYELVRNMFLMLVPGTLFINSIMGFIMGNVVPFMQHNFVSKCIYIWKCLPEKLLDILKAILPWSPASLNAYPRRSAEGAFMAGQIGLPYEYTGIVNNMFISVLMLNFISPYNTRIFLALVAWCVFYYCYSRYMHLRVQSVCFYSTKRLDACAIMMFGLPLSVVAISAFKWAIRAELVMSDSPGELKLAVAVLIFFSISALWVLILYKGVRPFDRQEVQEESRETVDDLRNETIYSWYNCNPVYTLKAAYHLQESLHEWDNPLPFDEKRVEATYYRPGKEYLFFGKETQPKILENLSDALEFETYLEWLLKVMDKFFSFLCCCLTRRRKDGDSEDPESRALMEMTPQY